MMLRVGRFILRCLILTACQLCSLIHRNCTSRKQKAAHFPQPFLLLLLSRNGRKLAAVSQLSWARVGAGYGHYPGHHYPSNCERGPGAHAASAPPLPPIRLHRPSQAWVVPSRSPPMMLPVTSLSTVSSVVSTVSLLPDSYGLPA